MAQPTWPISRCVICSVVFATVGFIGSLWALADIAANVYGDYRKGVSGVFGLIPFALAALGFAISWILRMRERVAD